MILHSGKRSFDRGNRVGIVAILNVTPDSSVDGGKYTSVDAALAKAKHCVDDGADIVEIGGESTGPGSKDVDVNKECDRVLPVVKALRASYPSLFISVDTWKAEVARQALVAGADMINDVTAGRGDPNLLSIVAKARCPIVLMYSKDASPRTTKRDQRYENVIATVEAFLQDRIEAAEDAGVDRSQIIIDPGLGHFLSSDPKYSLEILAKLECFARLGPVLVSPSRKSFLAGPNNLPVKDRLAGTLAATTAAILHGATFIRTHDVRETKHACDIALAVKNQEC